MSFRGLVNQTVTIEHRSTAGADEYGNDAVATISTTVTDAYVEQIKLVVLLRSSEDLLNRETYRSEWLVVLLPGTVVDGSDRIHFGTHTLEVIGPPSEAYNPRSRGVHHIEAHCREVTG